MTQLKVKRLDSPLGRRTPPATETQPEKPAEPEPPAPTARRARPAPARTSALTSVPAAAPARPDSAAAVGDSLSALPDPPPLSEQLELLSTRLPASLRRSITDLTTAMRARSGTRQSQKALPEQEVLAVLIWLAGDPEDPAAIHRLGQALDAYRGRRYAAAARTLGS